MNFRVSFLSILLAGVFLCVPAFGDTLITDLDDPGSGAFWSVDDSNPDTLSNSSKAAEEAWLEALLRLTYNDPSVTFLGKYEFPDDPEYLSVTGFDPNDPDIGGSWDDSDPTTPIDWQYAVVKIGGPGNGNGNGNGNGKGNGNSAAEPAETHWAYVDKDFDGLLTTPEDFEFDFAISHISFFSSGPTIAAVPEPATMLLVGSGLVGLGVIGRKKYNKK